MDNEGLKPVPPKLHEDIIRHIAQFLDGDDALALSLAFSGLFPSVPSIFWKTIRKNSKYITVSVNHIVTFILHYSMILFCITQPTYILIFDSFCIICMVGHSASVNATISVLFCGSEN